MGQVESTPVKKLNPQPDLSEKVEAFNSDEEEISVDELIDSLVNQSETLLNNFKVKAMIDNLDPNGYNLLHRAIIAGNKELIVEFIKYGADLNISTKFDHTPLELALYHKNNEISLLIWNELKQNPIPRIERISWYKLIWNKLMLNM